MSDARLDKVSSLMKSEYVLFWDKRVKNEEAMFSLAKKEYKKIIEHLAGKKSVEYRMFVRACLCSLTANDLDYRYLLNQVESKSLNISHQSIVLLLQCFADKLNYKQLLGFAKRIYLQNEGYLDGIDDMFRIANLLEEVLKSYKHGVVSYLYLFREMEENKKKEFCAKNSILLLMDKVDLNTVNYEIVLKYIVISKSKDCRELGFRLFSRLCVNK